jgi:hypothetical protein
MLFKWTHKKRTYISEGRNSNTSTAAKQPLADNYDNSDKRTR